MQKLGGALPQPNTWIGGVGATYITSAADYANMSGQLTESDIQNFQVDVNNNVSFYIGINYTLSGVNFNNVDEMTYFIDAEGKLMNVYYFGNCDGLKHFYTPLSTSFFGQFGFQDNLIVQHVNFESIGNINDRYQCCDSRLLKKLDLRSLTSITNNRNEGVINDNFALEYLFIGNLATIRESQRIANLVRNTLRFPCFYRNGINASNFKVYHHPDLGVQDRNAFMRGVGSPNVGDTITVDGVLYTCSASPTNPGDYQEDGNNSVTNFITLLNSETRPFNSGLSFNGYRDVNSFAIECDTFGAIGNGIPVTLGSGNTGFMTLESSELQFGHDVHPSLLEMREFAGATLIEISAPITVNTPTSLAATNQTSNSVDLTFSHVDNAKGTDGYEVWVDDGTVFRKWFEYQEISTSGDTVDLADVVADVGSLNGVKIKIRAFDAHYSFSEFSNEVTL